LRYPPFHKAVDGTGISKRPKKEEKGILKVGGAELKKENPQAGVGEGITPVCQRLRKGSVTRFRGGKKNQKCRHNRMCCWSPVGPSPPYDNQGREKKGVDEMRK